MSEQELKKLSRADLLALLLEQTRENDQLRARLAQAQRELADRRITIENAGSIAEASLALSNVFEAAQEAADRYLADIARMHRQAEKELEAARKEAAYIIQTARRNASGWQT